MQLLIDKTKLELLFEQKREYIGNKVTVDSIIASVSFLLSVFSAEYDHIKLTKDIIGVDMIQHNHSLIVIRDTFRKPAMRFLVYYDERWDCKLFLNLKTVSGDNENAILEYLSASLQIPRKELKAKYLTSRVQEKYSVSHGETRVYNHRLYEVTIQEFAHNMKENDFSVNGVHYFWMTIPEMQKDKNIMDKNMDVVDFVNETIQPGESS